MLNTTIKVCIQHFLLVWIIEIYIVRILAFYYNDIILVKIDKIV